MKAAIPERVLHQGHVVKGQMVTSAYRCNPSCSRSLSTGAHFAEPSDVHDYIMEFQGADSCIEPFCIVDDSQAGLLGCLQLCGSRAWLLNGGIPAEYPGIKNKERKGVLDIVCCRAWVTRIWCLSRYVHRAVSLQRRASHPNSDQLVAFLLDRQGPVHIHSAQIGDLSISSFSLTDVIGGGE